MLSFTIGKSSIAVFLDGEFNSIDESHINYFPLLAELKKAPEDRDLDAIRTYVTVVKMIEVFTTGHVTVFEDEIHYGGAAVNNYMTQRMIELIQQGFDIGPWARFMDNVYLNPAEYAHSELYEWMEKAHMPLTPDGCFLAFKKVRSDYTDCHTGKFDNSPGSIVEMDRGACDPVRSRTCSSGLHFCSVGYLSSFGGQRVVVVKVNPKDVTSIPDDYNFTKGRTCRYEVIAELTSESAARHACWRKGLVNLENPSELPHDAIRNFKLPSPALDEPVRAESDPLDELVAEAQDMGFYDIDDHFEQIEDDMIDAGKVGACPLPTKEQLANIRSVTTDDGREIPLAAKRTFVTADGRAFTEKEIREAIADASKRAAARILGIQDSTLRGWLKKLGL